MGFDNMKRRDAALLGVALGLVWTIGFQMGKPTEDELGKIRAEARAEQIAKLADAGLLNGAYVIDGDTLIYGNRFSHSNLPPDEPKGTHSFHAERFGGLEPGVWPGPKDADDKPELEDEKNPDD